MKRCVVDSECLFIVSYWFLQANYSAIHGRLYLISLLPVNSLIRWLVCPCVLYMMIRIPLQVAYWSMINTVDIHCPLRLREVSSLSTKISFVSSCVVHRSFMKRVLCLWVGPRSCSLAPYERACKEDWLFADIWFLCVFLGFGWVSKRYWFMFWALSSS